MIRLEIGFNHEQLNKLERILTYMAATLSDLDAAIDALTAEVAALPSPTSADFQAEVDKVNAATAAIQAQTPPPAP